MVKLNKDEAEFVLEAIAFYLEENRSFLSEFEDTRPHDVIDRIFAQLPSKLEE